MSRNHIVIGLAVALSLALSSFTAGCSGSNAAKKAQKAESSPVTIRVTGTPGLRFSGNIGDAGQQIPVKKSTVPTDLTIENPRRAVLINLQKLDQAGTLKVAVLRGGKELAHGQNEAQWGMVNLTVPMTE